MSRLYDKRREAWTPRPWPSALALAVLVIVPVAVWYAAGLPERGWWLVPLGAAYGLAIGVGVVKVQWWLWRRQHPRA